ncbi:MAG TPA: ATP-binding protein, partial [Clostridia bacterium]|nr:ATP-binding protein [Clostridia bacterium]
GHDITAFFRRDNRSKVKQALEAAATLGRHEENDLHCLRHNGTEFAAKLTLSALKEEGGSSTHSLIAILQNLSSGQQVTEDTRAEVERAVRRRTAEYEADQRELQELTYTVAMELRTPLRHIDSFVELLQKTVGDKLDPKSRGGLKTISEAARHVGKLTDELLTFSRIGRTEMYQLHFSLAEVVKEVLQELRHETENRRIEWVVGDLPEVVGDPTMLALALTNLISNALKFTRTRKQAHIEIGSRIEDQEVIVYVADNGLGFDPRYRDKLFGIFQRLHTGKEFDGLGVGLANVRRIVRRHGGRTWAEGSPDRGATFYFSLPRKAIP